MYVFMSFAMLNPYRLSMVSCALRSDKLKGAIHKRNFWDFFILHTRDGYRLNFDILVFIKIEKSSVKTLLDRA